MMCVDADLQLAKAVADERDIIFRIHYEGKVIHSYVQEMIELKGSSAKVPPIFFLSNKAYQDHREDLGDLERRELITVSYWNSGVGRLRLHFREALARKSHKNLQHAITELKDLLIGLDMQCSKTWLEHKKMILPELRKPGNRIRRLLPTASPGLVGQFSDIVVKTITNNKKQWQLDANKHMAQWKKINHMSLRAICSKRGRHTARAKKSQSTASWDFGETICSIMEKAVISLFEELEKTITDTERKICFWVLKALEKIEAAMKGKICCAYSIVRTRLTPSQSQRSSRLQSKT